VAPAVPLNLGAHAVGAVAHLQFGNAEPGDTRRGEFRLGVAQGHLFLKREALQGILDALLDGGILLQVERSSLLPPGARRAKCKEQQGGQE